MMNQREISTVLDHIGRFVGEPRMAGLNDKQLLERFANQRDEQAFAVLVRRHGARVLGVCRRVVQQAQEAEDVFQATFLVLARKAAHVNWHESVGNWLYEVAYRLAHKARQEMTRRRVHEQRAAVTQGSEPRPEWMWRELSSILDDELSRLSPKHRMPLLLCYLEGMTQDEASRKLGWSLRTLRRRLEYGRKILRARLTGRGLVLPAVLVTANLSGQEIGSVSVAQVEGTVRAATAFASGKAEMGPTHIKAAALAEGGLKAMLLDKLRRVVAAIVVVCMAAGGTGMFLHGALAEKPVAPEQRDPAATPAKAADDSANDHQALQGTWTCWTTQTPVVNGQPLPPVRKRITWVIDGDKMLRASDDGFIEL
ncbi:MAG TPA: sigma-70 family RNA polymerase sigma factor, partial [Gemmataceae bacterium]|nr:sigma-70 family RNA polymerase sigma factor [Gemmataceae bacterium]